ncbi:hypothetical protein CEXT_288501 [Caerostris extrusa]|uniref:Uncharacterized protein n=1 Tax=Caerostris extrusa TaxID=172846 RepID=A0AAV4U8E0_CAEEX|nr:hypothetical protein CEXT_288501 [Caerostris extrusa]
MVETGLPPMGSFRMHCGKEVNNRSSYPLSLRRRKLCSLVDDEASKVLSDLFRRGHVVWETEEMIWDISRENLSAEE